MDGAPRSKRLRMEEKPQKKLIVVIEDCSLEVGTVGKESVILCSDKHANFLRKNKKDPADYRPDILHQVSGKIKLCLLMLLDSPLNRSGHLQVYFRTKRNVLVEVSPQCRIPRTFDRFCGLMVQLLHKLSIRAAESSQRLLTVVKNPITQHLPIGCRKYSTSLKSPNLVRVQDLIKPDVDEIVVIVIGGISRGKIAPDYTEGELKISNFPLSAALTCAKVTNAFEEVWGVV